VEPHRDGDQVARGIGERERFGPGACEAGAEGLGHCVEHWRGHVDSDHAPSYPGERRREMTCPAGDIDREFEWPSPASLLEKRGYNSSVDLRTGLLVPAGTLRVIEPAVM
jgi:hypothetical protein